MLRQIGRINVGLLNFFFHLFRLIRINIFEVILGFGGHPCNLLIWVLPPSNSSV
jgi:hypothetical protein